MKFNLIVVASTILLVSGPAGALAAGKMQIPPPPRETLPGAVVPPAAVGRPQTVKSAAESEVTLVGSGTHTCANEKVQRFVTYVDLKAGEENAPLTLHLTNDGFKWFRFLIANQIVATEKSLGGRHEGNLDLTGVIQPGTNQVVIQAGGVPGSKLEWKITTPAIAKLDKVDPDEVLVGEDVKLKGKNFSTVEAKDEVWFNHKKGHVTKAKPTELTVTVPSDAEIGDNTVSVKVNGVESNKLKLKIRGIPEISGSNLQGVPPGQTLIIFGKNFSKDLGENQVFFDETPATVTGGDTTQLSVTVPFIPQHVGHTPSSVRVEVGKVMSKNTISVQIGPQMFVDPSMNPGGADIPTFNPRDLPRY